MINLTEKIKITDADQISTACHEILRLMTEKVKSKEPISRQNSVSKQYHNRFAIVKFWRHRSKSVISSIDLNLMFEIAHLGEDIEITGPEIYHSLTGSYPDRIEDMTGLKVPFRELLCLLWAKEVLTLPHTFDMNAVWTKNPELRDNTHGFITQIAKGDSTLERAARSWQYLTSWHAPTYIYFDELWEAIPELVNLRPKQGRTSKFELLSWVKRFSAVYPGIISPDQAFYLMRYQMHLAGKHRQFSDAHPHAMSYDKYVEYFAVSPEEAAAMSKADRQDHRNKLRPRKKDSARPMKHTKETTRQSAIRERTKEKNTKPLAPTPLHNLIAKLNSAVTAEDYMLFVELPRRPASFDWITDDFYPGRPDIGIQSRFSQWIVMSAIFIAKIEKSKNAKSYREAKINCVRFLFDYVFCYLPHWKELHPDSTFTLPEKISDFERIVHWCDDLVDDETVRSILKTNNIYSDSEAPLTALQLRTLMHSKKLTKIFINTIYDFFELVRTHGPALGFVDGGYANPVNRRLDATGSGGRTSSNKKPFPRDASAVAKAYMHALDTTGIQIRNMILNGEITPENIVRIKSSNWIDLTELGLETTASVRAAKTPMEPLTFSVTTIPNIFNWWYGDYFIPDTNREQVYTGYIPWLSTVRMLAIGLFAGQRIQNGQWLDHRTFDKYYNQRSIDTFNLCMLYVNTDKSGNSRDVVIDGYVMKSLFDEREFQTEVYTRPPEPVYYENDPLDPNEYGLICALFRSPWGRNDLPFNDGTYSKEWISFCRGLEQIYNSIVDGESHHSFIAISDSGRELAVHVPHSLRVTWITHMRLYGHLEVTYAAKQAGHRLTAGPALMSEYYTVPTAEELLESINLANLRVADSAYEALMGKTPSPSSPDSAIMRGWQEDKQQLIKDQSFRSHQFYLLDSKETGMDLIATDGGHPGFHTNCICMRNGDCSEKLLKFTGRARVCSLCDAAVWGIDHLPGINVCMRQAYNKCLQLIDKINQLNEAKLSQSDVEPYHHDLTITRYELASYNEIASQLGKVLDDDNRHGYISRYRDLNGAKRHAVDLSNPHHRVIANIIDSEAYPHLTSPNYPYLIERAAKSPDLLSNEPPLPKAKKILACQISSILRNTDFTIDEILELYSKAKLALEDSSA